MTDTKREACAVAAHMANRAYCIALGDMSQPLWGDAPEWQKDSARNGVNAALDPQQTPEHSHRDWSAQKEAEGWKFGLVKDVSKKEHPCLVAYSDLPPEQKFKDTLFLDTVRAVAKALELKSG